MGGKARESTCPVLCGKSALPLTLGLRREISVYFDDAFHGYYAGIDWMFYVCEFAFIAQLVGLSGGSAGL